MLSDRHLIDTPSLTADDITQILDTARSFAEIPKIKPTQLMVQRYLSIMPVEEEMYGVLRTLNYKHKEQRQLVRELQKNR